MSVSERNQSSSDPEEPSAATGIDLTGDLPCVGCGYNLRGLSIRSVCSECGTPVRATILAQVDPMAEQLQPLIAPKLTASGLLLWSWGAVLAALIIWASRIFDLSDELFGITIRIGPLKNLAIVGLIVSMAGALVLIKPVAIVRPWDSLKAVGGLLAYVPLIYIHDRIHNGFDVDFGAPFVGAELLAVNRSYLRLAECALIVVIILGQRGNAVALAERSLVMRTGRVDTQPLLALVWTMLIAMGGDVLVLVFGSESGTIGGVVETLALVMIAVGSFLFTLGLVGVGFDTVRLRPILLQPAPGLTDIFCDD